MSYLDNIIVMPLRYDKNEDDFIEAYFLILDTVILDTDISELQKIQELSGELSLYSLKFLSFNYRIKQMSQIIKLELQLYLVILFSVLIFGLISIICILFEYISNYTREFVLHIMYGATLKSIAYRILLQIYIIIFISDIIVMIIMKPSIAYLVTFIFSLILGAVITIFPILKLMKANINTLLKRSQ